MKITHQLFFLIIIMLILFGCKDADVELEQTGAVCSATYTPECEFSIAEGPEVILTIVCSESNTLDIVISEGVTLTEAVEIFFEHFNEQYGNVIRKKSDM